MPGRNLLPHTIDDNNPPPAEEKAEVVPIAKPSTFSLEKFKSKRAATVANVETLQTGLPHHNIAQAKDFVRLHPNEEAYWSPELCFVNVPIKGQKRDTLHLIDEDLAMRYLPSGKNPALPPGARDQAVRRVLPLPYPDAERGQHLERNQLDRLANRPRQLWVQATSRKEEGVDAYKIDLARDHDAFPEPKWPTAIARRSDQQDLRRSHDRSRRSPGAAALDRRTSSRCRE